MFIFMACQLYVIGMLTNFRTFRYDTSRALSSYDTLKCAPVTYQIFATSILPQWLRSVLTSS